VASEPSLTTEQRPRKKMYKIASEKKQAAISRVRLADLMNGQPEHQTAEDRRRNLIAVLEQAQTQLKMATGAARIELRKKVEGLQEQLRNIKKEMQNRHMARAGLEEVFVQVAREMLPKLQYRMLMAAAQREWQQRQDAAKTDHS
jgi:hypothetical protein